MNKEVFDKLAKKRREKADLLYDITKLVTDCENDNDFFERLTWVLTWASNNISSFNPNKLEVEG